MTVDLQKMSSTNKAVHQAHGQNMLLIREQLNNTRRQWERVKMTKDHCRISLETL